MSTKKPLRKSLFDTKDAYEDENELSAERNTQVESVLRVISDSIEKLKISIIMPRLLENPITIRQRFSNTQYEKCVKLIEEYLRDKKKDDTIPPYLSPKLISLIDLLHRNHTMLNFVPEYLDDISQDDKSLLEAFNLLHYITEQRLHKSAMSELAKEKNIHQVYHENELMKKNIADFKDKLHRQKIILRWKLAAKKVIIKKYEEDLAYKKWENNMKIQQEIVESSRRIRNIHATSTARQKDLEEELEKTKVSYEKILKDNLKQEKEIREEKNKLLLQLQALVKKYDQNIGDKIKENMQLQEEYREQKDQFDKFMIQYQYEEMQYETIVRQKEEEEKRIHEEKIMLFMMNRAARIIQRAYRKYRREKKKKAKKGKGGKGGKGKKK